ncbi:hypothetical protein C8R45DRAFT_1077674 [Mycena sanguinolenta]|nr:hypothetical protein C8R45DRAFT_1077674 [Mycena sanguinolenta]
MAEDRKSATKSRRRSTIREFGINRHAEGVEPSQRQAQIGTLRRTHRTAEATRRAVSKSGWRQIGRTEQGERRRQGNIGGCGGERECRCEGDELAEGDGKELGWGTPKMRVAMRKARRGDKQRRVDYGNVVPAMPWMPAVESEKTRLDIVSTRATDEGTDDLSTVVAGQESGSG